MRKLPTTPSVVPGLDSTVYVVLDDFGNLGASSVRPTFTIATAPTVVRHLVDGQFNKPLRVITFNTAEGWSADASEEIARAVLERARAEALGRATQVAAADEFVFSLLPIVHAIRQTGAQTLEAMSQALNQRGSRTARGGMWRASSVANLFVRAQRTSALQESLL